MLNQKILFTVCILLYTINCLGQDLEYLGLVQLPDSSLITYKLQLRKRDGILEGYSFTDLNGKHETKSKVIGKYNQETNKLTFREVNIIYTKSPIAELDFCHIYFTGKLKNLKGKARIKGSFDSYYDDLDPCLSGTLEMKPALKVQKRSQTFQKRVNKMKRIPDSTKQKINMDKLYNRYNKNALSNGENINIIWKYDHVKLVVWDESSDDGDKIKVDVDNTTLLDDYTVSTKKSSHKVALDNEVTTITLTALNLGTMKPNTARIAFVNVLGETIDLSSYLKVGEAVTFTFYKEKPERK